MTRIRKIEQGKSDLQLEKANQVLKTFSHILAPVSLKLFEIDYHEKSEDIL